jgi:hypothetical protein
MIGDHQLLQIKEQDVEWDNKHNYHHRYNTKYFLAILTDPETIDIHQRFTTMQKREISAIGWKTLADCAGLSRPHYIQRIQLLNDLSNLAETVEVRLPKE